MRTSSWSSNADTACLTAARPTCLANSRRPSARSSARRSAASASSSCSRLFAVEASHLSVRLAMAYRNRWGRDVVIDLIGYRRFGHNETDEPAYTQPLMAAAIKQHPPVS